MNLTEYETTVVMRPDLGGDAVETTLDRVREVLQTGGGKLLAINHWGKKRLAYPIAKQSRGIYVHTHFLGGSGLVAELERNLRISDNVLRYMTVQLAKDIDPAERQTQEYVRPQYDAEEPSMDEETSVSAASEGRGDVEEGYWRDKSDAEDADEPEEKADEAETKDEE